jgi:hypothetical protein
MSVLVRNVDPALLAALSAPVFFPIILVYLDWPNAPVRVHSNVGQVSFDSQTWSGVGNFGDMTIPEEAKGLASQSAELRLVGLPDELDAYLDDPIRNRAAKVWFGAVTERTGNVLLAPPAEVFSGYMDAMRDVTAVDDQGLTRGVILTVAQGPSQRARAEVYHTYEDQITAFPGDTAGRFSINIEAEVKKIRWPE